VPSAANFTHQTAAPSPPPPPDLYTALNSGQRSRLNHKTYQISTKTVTKVHKGRLRYINFSFAPIPRFQWDSSDIYSFFKDFFSISRQQCVLYQRPLISPYKLTAGAGMSAKNDRNFLEGSREKLLNVRFSKYNKL
jgi:hypothetical protein